MTNVHPPFILSRMNASLLCRASAFLVMPGVLLAACSSDSESNGTATNGAGGFTAAGAAGSAAAGASGVGGAGGAGSGGAAAAGTGGGGAGGGGVATCSSVYASFSGATQGPSCTDGAACSTVADCSLYEFGQCGALKAVMTLNPTACTDGACVYSTKFAGPPDGVCCSKGNEIWYICVGMAPGPECVCK